MKYLSTFSGIEAASVAWEPLGWTPVGFSEIESYPSAVLAHHYPTIKNFGDVTKYQEWTIEPFRLLVGGSPCQSFSVAGLRKGLADPRGNLMLVFLGLAEKYKPKWIVWENVPGVLSSNGGRDFGTFLGALGELGYGYAYRVLDAQYIRTQRFPGAVPQRRRRVFVIGCLGSWTAPAAVLFEQNSLSRNPPPGRGTRKVFASGVEEGIGGCNSCTGGDISPTVTSKWKTGYGGPSGNNEMGNMVYGLDNYNSSIKEEVAKTISSAASDIDHVGGVILPSESSVKAHAFKIRSGSETETGEYGGTPGKKAGKGYLGQDECAFTISTSPDQQVAIPEWPKDVAPTLNALYGDKMGLEDQHAFGEAGLFVKNDAYPIDMRNATRTTPYEPNTIHREGLGIGEADDPSPTLTQLFVPAVAQGVTIAFNDVNGTRKDRPNGGMYIQEDAQVSPALTQGNNDLKIIQPIAIQGNLVGRDNGGPQGVGASDEGAMYTLTKGDVHAVAQPMAFDWQSGGDSRGLDPKDTAQLQRCQVPAVMQPIPCATDLYNGTIDGEVSHAIRSGNGNAMGGVPSVMQPIAMSTKQLSQDIGDNIAHTLCANDYKEPQAVFQPLAFSFDSLSSNSMKSDNPISGCNQVEVARTLDTGTPEPSKNQGGIAIVQSVAIDKQSTEDGSNIDSRDTAQYQRCHTPGAYTQTKPIAVDVYNQKVTGDVVGVIREQHGTNMNAVLEPMILNDQGGGVMNVSTNGVVGTLRSETHGHEPIIIDRAAFNQGTNALYDPLIEHGETMPSLMARGPHAIGHNAHFRKSTRAKEKDGEETWIEDEVSNTLNLYDQGDVRATSIITDNKSSDMEQQKTNGFKMSIRRLTPKECERLQGFPDNYTNIPYRNKEESPDGPRYKALGNSMAVNVMEWIGQRIDMVDKLIGDDTDIREGEH